MMPIFFFFLFLKKCQHCEKSKISELLTVGGTWIYEFESQRRAIDKQWLCKDHARPVIVKRKKVISGKSFICVILEL